MSLATGTRLGPYKIISPRGRSTPRRHLGLRRCIFDPFLRYAVTRDGQRFLIPTAVNESDSTPATIMFNWIKEGNP